MIVGSRCDISAVGLLLNITTFVTVACRKNEHIEKTARTEVPNFQGTQNTKTVNEKCST